MADMNFLPMSVNDDMTEPVHGSEALRKFLREALIADVVGTLAAGWDAHDNGVVQVHQRKAPCHFPCSPSGGITSAVLEVKNTSVEVNLLERSPLEVSLWKVVV